MNVAKIHFTSLNKRATTTAPTTASLTRTALLGTATYSKVNAPIVSVVGNSSRNTGLAPIRSDIYENLAKSVSDVMYELIANAIPSNKGPRLRTLQYSRKLDNPLRVSLTAQILLKLLSTFSSIK